MKIRWIGQSGYIVSSENSEIIIDPYLSDAVGKLEGRPRLVPPPISPADIGADAVVCTHAHIDHLDLESALLMQPDTYFITTGEGRDLLLSAGLKNVSAIRAHESITVGDIEITAVPAFHTVEAVGLIVRAEGHTLYFSGDTLFDEGLFVIADYRPDFTFICINGRLGNMNAEQALRTAKAIGAPVNIPNHYGMFASNTEDPERFAGRIDGGFIMEFNKTYRIESIFENGHTRKQLVPIE